MTTATAATNVTLATPVSFNDLDLSAKPSMNIRKLLTEKGGARANLYALPVGAIKRLPNHRYGPLTAIAELAESIKARLKDGKSGLIHPIVLVRIGDDFYLVAGNRRYEAFVLVSNEMVAAGLPAPKITYTLHVTKAKTIKELQRELLTLQVEENVHTAPLTVMSEAHAMHMLHTGKDGGEVMTQVEIGKLMKIPQPTVSNMLTLVTLVPELQDLVDSGCIRREAAYKIAKHLKNDKDAQRALAAKIAAGEADPSKEADKLAGKVKRISKGMAHTLATRIAALPGKLDAQDVANLILRAAGVVPTASYTKGPISNIVADLDLGC